VKSILSIIQRANLTYPDSTDFFSPSDKYPEYPYEKIAQQPNLVYRTVRDCLAQSGLDSERYGTSKWNPLGEIILEGSKVFVLCNFVYHRRVGESQPQFFAKCSHGSVLRALIDYLLIAVGSEGTIRFGNAPVQSCNWNQVLEETGAAKVVEFYRSQGSRVEASDLRMFVAERDLAGRIRHLQIRDEPNQVISIDLAKDSLLDTSSVADTSNFRVSEYDPARTKSFHSKSQHVYVVHRQILESDVIISLPKLKTHQKVGITCGLKGCVGAIAHKDCLAHHRFGPPEGGGDEYPDDPLGLLQLQSKFHDYVWHMSPQATFGNLLRVIDRTLRRVQYYRGQIIAGSWWGNDTAWRMALDIARIIIHATPDGQLCNEAIRPHYVLVDGVLGGEGNGPLRPEPVQSGVLLFGTDLPATDYACASIMGFEPAHIPLVKEAFELRKYRLTKRQFGVGKVVLNGKAIGLRDIAQFFRRSYQPPPGWVEHIELDLGT
jgi:hypothetical protein